MSFLSTYTGVALVNTSNSAGTITLPLISEVPNRFILFKDMYGNLLNNPLTFNTAAPSDTFEDGTTTKVVNDWFGNYALYGYSNKWYTIGGSSQINMTLSNLNISSINNSPIAAGSLNTAQLVSTVAGLGTARYVSTASLASTIVSTTGGLIQGIVELINNLGSFGYISTLDLISSIDGLGTVGYLSSGGQGYFSSVYINMLPQDAPSWDSNNFPALGFDPDPRPLVLDVFGSARIIKNLYIGSTTTVIGTSGIATAQVSSASVRTSTIQMVDSATGTIFPIWASASNLVFNGSNLVTIQSNTNPQFLSTFSLLSTTAGLQTSLLSTTGGLQTSLLSTTGGLRNEITLGGYLSTTSLLSTTAGLQTSLLSTTGGLRREFNTAGFLSTPNLNSTVRGLTDNLVSTTGGLRNEITLGGYLSTTSLLSTTAGLQTSLLSTTGGLRNEITLGGYLSTTSLLSTTAGLQTSLLSTTGGLRNEITLGGYLSTTSLISTTAGLQTSLLSTTGGLRREFNTAAFLSTPNLNSTVRGLTDNLVSTTGGVIEVSELVSTITSLRTNLSSVQLNVSSIGVGLQFPAFNTDVLGNLRVTANTAALGLQISSSSNNYPLIQMSGGNSRAFIWAAFSGAYGQTGDGMNLSYNFYNDDSSSNTYSGNRIINSNGNASLIKLGYGQILFATSTINAIPQTRMILDQNGNFGIGCNAPTALLDVNGTAEAISLSSIQANISSVGIGVRFPAAHLDVNGTTRTITLSSLFVNVSTISSIAIQTSSLQVNSLTIGTGTGWVNLGPIQTVAISSIQANANDSFAITFSSLQTRTSSVNFGIPNGWFTVGALQTIVISSIQQNTATSYISSLYAGSTTTTQVGYVLWANGPSRIQQLLIGQTSTVASQFHQPGFDLQMLRANQAAQPTGTTFINYSDKRIKENIVDANLDRCYEDIRNVPLRRFRYISSFDQEAQVFDRHVLGFIAQEVSTIVPKAVIIKEGLGYSNLSYFNIDQLNMSLYGAVKKTMYDKEILESTVKGQRVEIETLRGKTSFILSTLEGLQGR